MEPEWIEHRRGIDGELLGWMRSEGDRFVVVDLLGRDRSDALEWLDAEEAMDELGMGYLADPYELQLESGEWLRVRIAEVSTQEIRVKKDDWGAIDIPQVMFTLPFPAPDTLRVFAGD